MNEQLSDNFVLFAGSSNLEMAQKVADILGISLGKMELTRFSDGEISVNIQENVRGKEVYLFQSTSAPTNEHLMELLLMADALHRSSAHSINAVIPYYGYARQDRRTRSERRPISARLVANLLSAAYIRRVVTFDLHAEQIQGFFDIPVDNIYGAKALIEDMQKQYAVEGLDDLTIVSPDVGGVHRARFIAKELGVPLCIVDKRRSKPGEAMAMNVIGNTEGKRCIVVDDMIDTGGTLIEVNQALRNHGAKDVVAYITHPVFSGKIVEHIKQSGLSELVVTDTITMHEECKNLPMVRQLSLAPLLAECIKRIVLRHSVSEVYNS